MKQLLSLATTTRDLICGRGTIAQLPQALKELSTSLPIETLCIISDENTWKAAGERVVKVLKAGLPEIDVVIETLPGTPLLPADVAYVKGIAERLRRHPGPFPIVVGSGTLNDLVKRAAYEVGIPYAVVATAVSVDGYLSHGAALLDHGYKHTLVCHAPLLVIGDLDILEAAPKSMTAAGYADLAAKIPAGADWLLAQALHEDQVDPAAWDLVQPALRQTLEHPYDLERIFLLLAASGVAMQYTGLSRPASGAEHLIAHIWEMRHHTYEGIPVSHGFHVGLGSLLSIAAMETLATMSLTTADMDRALHERPTLSQREQLVGTMFHAGAESVAIIDTLRTKYPTRERLERRMRWYLENQQDVLRAIRTQNLPYQQFRTLLAEAGCPVTAEETGLTREEFIQSIIPAQYLRDRYTILDLMDDLNIMDQVIESILHSETYLR